MEHHVAIMIIALASTRMTKKKSLRQNRKLKRSPGPSRRQILLRKAVAKGNAAKAIVVLTLRNIKQRYRVSTSTKDNAIKETSAATNTKVGKKSQTLRLHLLSFPLVEV